MRDIRHLVVQTPGPNWLAGKTLFDQPGLTEDGITAFATADPAVLPGLLTFEVRPWLAAMKA